MTTALRVSLASSLKREPRSGPLGLLDPIGPPLCIGSTRGVLAP